MSQTQKRPRAGTTQSSSSPQRTRKRVEDHLESITLFGEGEIMGDLDASLFDGQLSDLTDSDDEIEMFEGEEVLGLDILDLSKSESPNIAGTAPAAGLDTPLGDWMGVREAANGYHLTLDEDLSGPDVEGLSVSGTNMDNDSKNVIKGFCRYLKQHWPSNERNSDYADKLQMAFVDPTGFWHVIFKEHFRRYMDFLGTTGDGNQNQRIIRNADRLFTQLEEEGLGMEGWYPFESRLLASIFDAAIKHLKDSNQGIQSNLKESHEVGKKIKAARQVGISCRKRAIWIPVTRQVEKPVLNQHIVETKELYDKGIESGAIDGDGIVVGREQGWRVINAPGSMDGSCYSLIFWEPSNPGDHEATLDKVVGACIYSAEKINPIFGNEKSEYVQLQCAAAVHNLKTKSSIDRKIKQGGLMMKDSGQQATYGVPYEILPTVEVVSKGKPTEKTIMKIEAQKQLRIAMKEYNPVIQAINFALLEGFLPRFAKEQYAKAAENQLLNRIGRPNTASFVTYGYCAGLHLDRDESVSHGLVIKRGKNVHTKESNFVLGNHKLIVRLTEGTHWFWRANVDAHGTTSNKTVVNNPGRWKTAKQVDKKEDAQWTRVNTIPRAVMMATLNSQR